MVRGPGGPSVVRGGLDDERDGDGLCTENRGGRHAVHAYVHLGADQMHEYAGNGFRGSGFLLQPEAVSAVAGLPEGAICPTFHFGPIGIRWEFEGAFGCGRRQVRQAGE